MTPPGAQFEISVDGKPRSYHDTKDVAIESAEFLKAKNRTARSRSKTCEAAKSPRWHSGRSESRASREMFSVSQLRRATHSLDMSR